MIVMAHGKGHHTVEILEQGCDVRVNCTFPKSRDEHNIRIGVEFSKQILNLDGRNMSLDAPNKPADSNNYEFLPLRLLQNHTGRYVQQTMWKHDYKDNVDGNWLFSCMKMDLKSGYNASSEDVISFTLGGKLVKSVTITAKYMYVCATS